MQVCQFVDRPTVIVGHDPHSLSLCLFFAVSVSLRFFSVLLCGLLLPAVLLFPLILQASAVSCCYLLPPFNSSFSAAVAAAFLVVPVFLSFAFCLRCLLWAGCSSQISSFFIRESETVSGVRFEW